ncbi:ABC transporter ATP-binding protein [Geochorda subterranea]|uniref:ABC transporter ATP-binding protein n=1 Tax=Geochorda subterranea TaxID=3109564 RepID=A0ABZ1BPB4_9FIRM|nr:ABC transporter ATP-binding protein [Limnochorda sp. LNt]WRP14569.1 ABC transporter ATP-binding protein [Limnochorda sp. LNt]
MATIEIRGVSKSFGRVRALDDVSLEVRDREFVVLLGPSGCGKTTLLRVVAGLEWPDRGRVLIGGQDVTERPPRQRGIAMVFQNYAVFPHLTVFENVAFGLRMRKVPAAEVRQRVERVAALVHIEELLGRYPAQLSGGQRQRVALARALAVEPEVLLMDEPLSNLDALLRLEMRAELKRLLMELRTTTLYVTHDQTEAMSLADRVAVMRGGRIVQYDTPLTVYQEPVDTFVGGFVGSPPMNFLRVRLGPSGADEATVVEGAAIPGPAGAREALLGIRPEDLQPVPAGTSGALPCRVVVVEALGAQQLVTLEWQGQSLKALLEPDVAIRPGERAWMRPKPQRIRWMDPVTGEAMR